jgi:hypothetical protein
LIASSIGLALLFRGFFQHWYGTDTAHTIRFIILWCLLPEVLTSIVISGINLHGKRSAF